MVSKGNDRETVHKSAASKSTQKSHEEEITTLCIRLQNKRWANWKIKRWFLVARLCRFTISQRKVHTTQRSH